MRLLNKSKEELLYHFGKGYAPLPKSVTIEVNYDCMFRCQTCQMWKNDFQPSRLGDKNPLSKLEVEEIIEDLFSLGVKSIHFGGGEPFLRKDFLSLVEYCKNRKFYCSTFSNGYLIGGDLAQKIILSKLDALHISLDGADRELHDRIRGVNGAFEHAVQAIRSINEKKKNHQTRFPEVFIHCTVSSINILKLPELVDLAKDLDVREIKFNYLSAVGKDIVEQTNRMIGEQVIGIHTFVDVSPTLLLQKEQIDKLGDIVKNLKKKAGPEIKCDIDPLFLNGDNHFLQMGKFPVSKCDIPWHSAIITPAGDVVPCSMFTEYKMGNLRVNSFEQIWNNKRARKIRRLLSKRLPSVCQRCCVVHKSIPSLWKRLYDHCLRDPIEKASIR